MSRDSSRYSSRLVFWKYLDFFSVININFVHYFLIFANTWRQGTSVSRYDSSGRIPESLKKLPSEAAKNTKANLIQKISQDNDMVRQEMAAMVQVKAKKTQFIREILKV